MDIPLVTIVYARADKVICPHCQADVDGWINDPRGLSSECDECGKAFRVHPDATVILS